MKITINPLSTESIDEAIRQIERYEKSLDEKLKEFIARMVGEGKMKAIEYVPVNTGVAMNSIAGYIEGGRGIIWAGGYCAYIEFGTGLRGGNLNGGTMGSARISERHPDLEWIRIMNWVYGVGGTIFTTKDGRTGWYYPVGDGTYRFTEGMPSRPFMYETSRYLKTEASRIMKEIFANG